MEVIRLALEMQAWSKRIDRSGQTLAFVPTMGFLHDGHLELMREGKRRCGRVAASIFVNPTQFNDPKDFEKYPRDDEGDLAKCCQAGCDAVFMPTPEQVYPKGYATTVTVGKLTETLCGPTRPGHFEGVATVVAKLFNLVLPHMAIFGEKDYQQLQVIRRMTADLNFPIEIVGSPTIREADGLAMSSRNARLTPAGRAQAVVLSQALFAARAQAAAGEQTADALIAAARQRIEAAGPCKIDYIEIVDAESLERLKAVDRPAVMALAVFIDGVRLIDNVRLN